MRIPVIPLVSAFVLALSLACADGPSSPPEAPGLRVTAGAGYTDTIGAYVPGVLEVHLVGPNGRPAPNEEVVFTGFGAGQGPNGDPTAAVRPEGKPWVHRVSVVDTTDADGRAAVEVRFGAIAGPSGVAVRALGYAFSDTARYTVLPGAAASLALAPRDTAVMPGNGLTLRTRVRDRWGNPRSDTATFTVARGPVTVAADGRVTGTQVGRAMVRASLAGLADSMAVSVVPPGTLSLTLVPGEGGSKSTIHTLNTDGTAVTPRFEVFRYGFATWSADGAKLVSHDDALSFDALSLMVYDLATKTRSRLFPPTTQVDGERWPARTRDGAWYFFNAHDADGIGVFRVRADGTGPLERLSPPGVEEIQPAPSPDGTRFAFVRQAEDTTWLRVRTLDTQAEVDLGVQGSGPRWSPDGSEIAYVGFRELRTIRPDGTGGRRVTQRPTLFSGGIDYSPDGRYLVAVTREQVLEIVVAATGEELPVPLPNVSGYLLYPSWKP